MNRQFDKNTTDLEVFAIKDTIDGRKAFIGYKGENGNFEYFHVPFTQPIEEINFYKNVAEKLWQLLDDIDTASDMFKPCEENGIKSYHNFYSYSLRKSAKRFELLKSDGYNLFTPEEFAILDKNHMDHYQYRKVSPDLMEMNSSKTGDCNCGEEIK